MAKDRVEKPFTTPLRRFHVGQVVDETEIDGQLSREYLIEKGFLSPAEADAEMIDDITLHHHEPDIPDDDPSAPEDKGVTDEHN